MPAPPSASVFCRCGTRTALTTTQDDADLVLDAVTDADGRAVVDAVMFDRRADIHLYYYVTRFTRLAPVQVGVARSATMCRRAYPPPP